MWKQLESKGASICGKWFQHILDTYPSSTALFLKQEKDSFLNPVGSTISQEIPTLYEELIHGMNEEKLRASLDRVIRIRAVQEFLPSQAIGFILLLKNAIREELTSELKESANIKDLIELESRIDKMALFAFDIYMACREKIFEIRVSELAAQSESVLSILSRSNQEENQIE